MTEQKPWEQVPTIRIAVDFPRADHEKIKPKLHHGQLAQLLRRIMKSIAILFEEKKVMDVVRFIHGEGELTLPIKKSKES